MTHKKKSQLLKYQGRENKMSNRWYRLPLAIKIKPKQYTTQLCRRVEKQIDSSKGKHIMA